MTDKLSIDEFMIAIDAVTAGKIQALVDDGKYKTHDDFLNDFGKEGVEFRFQFSIMNLVKDSPNEDWFFWSEYDRLAGYRKMQVTGAIISSFDAVIHEMNDDPDKLKYGKKLFLQMISDEEEIDSAYYNKDDFNSVLWEKGYNDYLMCRDKFSEIDEPNISDESTPIETGIEYVVKKFDDIVSNRPAAVCVNFATAVLSNSVFTDPKDRYYYQTKAPIIVKLEGHHLTLHSLFIEEFFRKIQDSAF
ncbi:MAG: hypothetical protein IH840_15485 [Candidatus Heimdallarchaeota archaeon]|nr:hypothetical protein [Candidatus Heimdallarchaeota archaeon]